MKALGSICTFKEIRKTPVLRERTGHAHGHPMNTWHTYWACTLGTHWAPSEHTAHALGTCTWHTHCAPSEHMAHTLGMRTGDTHWAHTCKHIHITQFEEDIYISSSQTAPDSLGTSASRGKGSRYQCPETQEAQGSPRDLLRFPQWVSISCVPWILLKIQALSTLGHGESPTVPHLSCAWCPRHTEALVLSSQCPPALTSICGLCPQPLWGKGAAASGAPGSAFQRPWLRLLGCFWGQVNSG